MACVCDNVGCAAGEAGARVMVGGVEVVADERPDFGRNRAAAASTGDSVVVSGVLTEGRTEADCFGDVAVMKATPLAGGSSGPATPSGGMS